MPLLLVLALSSVVWAWDKISALVPIAVIALAGYWAGPRVGLDANVSGALFLVSVYGVRAAFIEFFGM